MAEGLNYYLLLELDPSVDDWPTIEKQIKKKQLEWSTLATSGPMRMQRKAQIYIDEIQSMTVALKDAESRREIAQDAKRRQHALSDQQDKQLSELIRFLRSTGSRADVATISKKLAGAFSDDEIRKRLRAAGVDETNAKGSAGKPTAKKRIDKVTQDGIQRNLDLLGASRGDLYSFLERSKTSSTRLLYERADEVYKELKRVGKIDPVSTGRSELAGVAKAVFKSDDERAKYDNFLDVRAMEGLRDEIDLAGQDGTLTLRQLDELVKRARGLGVRAEDARAFIDEVADKRKWRVEVPAAGQSLPESRACGFCSAVARSAEAVACWKCSEPLYLECPRCKRKTPTENLACDGCGFRTGDGPVAHAQLREAKRLAARGEFGAAMACIDRALEIWPEWNAAVVAKTGIAGTLQKRDRDLRAIDALIDGHQLKTALAAIGTFELEHGANSFAPDKKRRLVEAAGRAERALAEAESLRKRGESEAAIDKYEQALSICADLEEATRAMAGIPPPAPKALRVGPLARGFHLAWEPVRARGTIGYRVLRKAAGAPTNDHDGELVAEVAGASVDEVEVRPGTAWHYAVFSVRQKAGSIDAARSGPHLRTAEVEELTVQASDGSVDLGWRRPHGCGQVEVWRKEGGPPSARGDGTRVDTSADGGQDAGLSNGRPYGYLVVAIFEDPQYAGREQATHGLARTVTPVAPAPAVADLRCEADAHGLLLRWTPPDGATVQIRQAGSAPKLGVGRVLPLEKANELGTLVPSAQRGSAQVARPVGRVFFVPLSVTSGTAVVGTHVEFTSVEPVTRLRCTATGSGMRLTWEWPAGLDEVLVCVSKQAYPIAADDRRAGQFRVTRIEYDRAHSWELREPPDEPRFFSVFARASGTAVFSAPAHVFAGPETRVWYEVKTRSKLFGGVQEMWIEVRCADGSLHSLPALRAVARHGDLPADAASGETVAEVSSLSLVNGCGRIEIAKSHWGRRFVRLFFLNDADAADGQIRLMPGSRSSLSLEVG